MCLNMPLPPECDFACASAASCRLVSVCGWACVRVYVKGKGKFLYSAVSSP